MTAVFGDELRELRHAAGLGQRELSAASGMSATSICRFERGQRRPTDQQTAIIIRALVDARPDLGTADQLAARLAGCHHTTRAWRQPMPKLGATPKDPKAYPGFRHDLAACRGLDPNIFHPAPTNMPAVAAAETVCRNSCLVMEGCLRYAVADGEPHGVWGGCGEDTRVVLRTRWDGTSPLVAECDICETSFVPLVDGECPACAQKKAG